MRLLLYIRCQPGFLVCVPRVLCRYAAGDEDMED